MMLLRRHRAAVILVSICSAPLILLLLSPADAVAPLSGTMLAIFSAIVILG